MSSLFLSEVFNDSMELFYDSEKMFKACYVRSYLIKYSRDLDLRVQSIKLNNSFQKVSISLKPWAEPST